MIFLDLDGVFADLTPALQRTAPGVSYATNPRLVWEMAATVPHLFRNLTPLPESQALFVKIIDLVGVSQCQVLTALPQPTGLLASVHRDKVEWVREYLSPLIQVNCVASWSLKKHFCRGPADILIDDSARNIDQWSAVGGTGILHTSNDTTWSQLVYAMKELR